MITDHSFDDYRNRKVLVMGLGSFGGGIGAVKFLASRGARVTVTDLRTKEKLADSLSEIHRAPLERLVLGGHQVSDFTSADLVVVNPAVKRNCPYLNAAIAAGVPVTSEMNLFWKWNPAPVIAVTGSNGKSTTTAMTHAIVQQFVSGQPGRRSWLGGNIGTSLLPIVDQIQQKDLVVLELSSFQLADLNRLNVSPHVAVVTNFAPNHLDWHSDLDDYRSAKQSILRWQTNNDIAILSDDDCDVNQWKTNGIRRGFGLRDNGLQGAYLDGDQAVIRINRTEQHWPLKSWLQLPGLHNLSNALAATAAAISVGASADHVQTALEQFQGLPHRLQRIAEIAGRRFFNDSLATTPESTEVALNAFEAPIILLAGGYDKQVDLSSMAKCIARRAKAVSLMGQTAPQLHQLILGEAASSCQVSPPQSSLNTAFEWAIDHSSPGDVILLSPGCASYDWFRNFADRGQQFARLVDLYGQKQSRGSFPGNDSQNSSPIPSETSS